MNISELIQAGQTGGIVLVLMATTIGALHALEPGHSKTMIAAYIIAVRGTVSQAVLLGVSAALSHSAVVWLIAMMGLYMGDELIGERVEPYLLMASGVVIIAIACWIFFQARAQMQHAQAHHHDRHHHHHVHEHEHHHSHDDGQFVDAHAREHASALERQLQQRGTDGATTNSQTIMFGLTGGLIPCPAAITVLLLCLSLGKISLGITLVASFSVGLALVMVGVGVAAAISLRYALKRSSFFDALIRYAPFASALLVGLLGAIMIWSGWNHMGGHLH